MEKTRDPPPNQKTDDQNVSNTEEQLEKNIDVSIQNDKRFDDLKIEAIEKGEENATISKAAEQLEQIIDAPNQDEFGLPCITDVSNNALATLVDVAGQWSNMEAQAEALMAMVSNPEAASSDAIAEDTQQNSNDVHIDIENPDTILFSSQSTLKRTKENEIIQISYDELTGQIVGTEGDENAIKALKDAKDDKVEGKSNQNWFSFSTLPKMLGSSINLINMYGSNKGIEIPSGNQNVANVDQETPKGDNKLDNKLGRHFKQQTWYSSFLEKPIIEKVKTILPFKKKGLNDVEKKYEMIKENALEGEILYMKSMNDEEFLLKEEIGRGAFGVVYRAKRLSDQKEVAVKVDHTPSSVESRLVKEWKYMKKLQGPAIPIIHCLLRRHDLEYNFLVMEKLDQEDLEKKFQNSNRDFSMKTLLMLADQMIENIEIIHEEGLLHNDLKPNNMSMGMDANNCSQLYLIDFGMCQSYREKNGKHVDYQDGLLNPGNPTFASLSAQKGERRSRRDDFESIAYILMYFASRGNLPWIEEAFTQKEIQDHFEQKQNLDIEAFSNDYPYSTPFCDLLIYAKGLEFDEKPDYAKMRIKLKEWYENLKVYHEWKFTEDNRLINRLLDADWKYGKKQWEKKDNCIVDLETGYHLGPNEKPGPGSIGFDPTDEEGRHEFRSPSGTEVDIHKKDLVLARHNKHEIGVKLIDGSKSIPEKDKAHAAKTQKANLEMFHWTEEELEDGWIHLKHPITGYLLEVSQCGKKLTYQDCKTLKPDEYDFIFDWSTKENIYNLRAAHFQKKHLKSSHEGLPYGAYIPTEEQKEKEKEKDRLLAVKYPHIFDTDKSRFEDFENLTKKDMIELLREHEKMNTLPSKNT